MTLQTMFALYADPNWHRLVRPETIGANVDELFQAERHRLKVEPQFTTKEGGIYDVVTMDGTHYAVPQPGLILRDVYFRWEAFETMFETPGIRPDPDLAVEVEVIRPAIVDLWLGRWIVLQKGEVRARRSVN
jgi:hypothetical protein